MAASAAAEPNVAAKRVGPPKSRVVYWIAAGIVANVIVQWAPVAASLDPRTGPTWGRIVLLVGLLQLAYAAWIVCLPDWSTLRVTQFALAGVATLYGIALGVVVVTPRSQAMLLEMDAVRDDARVWCSVVLIATGLMTYVCGRVWHHWRKAQRLPAGST